MFKQYRRYKIFLMLADVLLSVFILASVVELRTSLPGRAMDPQTVLPSMMIYVMQALLLNMVFVLTEVYAPERISRVTHHLGRFTSAYLLGVSVFAGLLFFTFRETSRLLVIYFSLTNYVALLSVRYALSAFLTWKRSGIAGVPVIVVGTLDNAIRVAENIIKDHSGVLRLVGFSDTVIPSQRSLPAPFLGHVNNLERIVREFNIEMVIIARTDVRSSEVEPLTLQPIIFQLERLPVRVYLAPDLFSLALVESEVERFGDLVLIGLRESVIRGAKRVRKRILDLVLCVLVSVFYMAYLHHRLDTYKDGHSWPGHHLRAQSRRKWKNFQNVQIPQHDYGSGPSSGQGDNDRRIWGKGLQAKRRSQNDTGGKMDQANFLGRIATDFQCA